MRDRMHRLLVLGLVGAFAAGAALPTPPVDLVTLYLKAMEFDPAFQAARSERLVADEVFKESRAAVLPALSATASGSETYQNIKSSDNILFTVGTSDFFSQTFSISLSQPVYRSEVFHRLPQARAEVRRAAATFNAAEQDLIYRAAEAFFTFLAAHDSLDFAVAERDAISRQLEETEQRLGSGLAKLTDVHDVRARYALAEAAEIDARDALEEARQGIAAISGEAPENLKSLSEGLPLVRPDSPEVVAWVETALFQNPKVQALQGAVDYAREEVRRQRAAYYPTLDLVASYNNSDSGGTIFGGGNEIATRELALRLAVPIFDGGRASALAQAAALRQDVATHELERERRDVDRRTRAAFQGVMSGVTRVEALVKSVFSHQAALVAKEEGWRAGLNTGLAVLDARRELFMSRRDLARARYLYVLNSLKLKQAAGNLGLRDLEQINAYLQ